jgi:hypothetical protein
LVINEISSNYLAIRLKSPQASWLFFKARLARNASRSDAGGGDEHIQIDTSGASNAVTITCETVHQPAADLV